MFPEIKPDSIIYKNPAHVLREDSEGWGVLVNLDSASSIALNVTGLTIWNLIDGKQTVKGITDDFCGFFDEVPSSVAEDVLETVNIFSEIGLIGLELEL